MNQINHKNKGMLLEQLINITILDAIKKDIAIFHKLNVPVNISKIRKNGSSILVEKAYIEKKSTTDYYGIFRGVFVTFEAKSTHESSMPFSNIKKHQWDYIDKIVKHGGIAFFVFGYMNENRYFIIDTSILQNINSRSISIDEASKFGYELDLEYPGKLSIFKFLEEKIKKI